MALSAEHARTQTQTLTDQAKQLAELAQKVALGGRKAAARGRRKSVQPGRMISESPMAKTNPAVPLSAARGFLTFMSVKSNKPSIRIGQDAIGWPRH